MDSKQADILRESVQNIKVGGWLISGFFGSGKSAVVLPAEKDGLLVAIKIFHPELVERYGKGVQLERINREKSLVGASHPNLVKIYDGGECPDTGHLYVVMERIPHRNLHEKLSEIPLAAIPKIITQIASAARFLEDRGLAHRDIKPENIAISDDFNRAVLLDLGVLLPIGLSNLTDVDQRFFIGTLRYSSPEFLLRQEENTTEGWRAVTFYQIGAVLHDLLMKKNLFSDFSEPFSRLVEAVRSERPHIFSEDTRSVALANRCLVKNAATRLELVSWPDFLEVDKNQASNALAARERIKQKQKYFLQTAPDNQITTVNHNTVKREIEDLCNQFESRIAALLNDLQCFPLRSTRSEKSISDRRCNFFVQFEPDLEKGLSHYLVIIFQIELIDKNADNAIFKTGSAAYLSAEESEQDFAYSITHFHVGELQSLLDSPSLENHFLSYLESAYEAGEQGKSPDVEPLMLYLNETEAAIDA